MTKPKYTNEEIQKLMDDCIEELNNNPRLAEESLEFYRKYGRIRPEDLKIVFDI
jgi:hypothetical protein